MLTSEPKDLWVWIVIIFIVVTTIILQLESEHIANWLVEFIEKYFGE